jgi:hypothetical protein
MLITSSFNPRKILTSMLRSNGVDTKFIGEIFGNNKDNIIQTSSGVMTTSQGDAAAFNNVPSYSLYINNMLYNNGNMHMHPNQTSRVFYFDQHTGSLHSTIKFQEKWNNSSDTWMIAVNPQVLELPDAVYTADPSTPDAVYYISSSCYYKTANGDVYNSSPLSNMIDPTVLGSIPTSFNENNFIILRVLSSPKSNEFRIQYDVFSDSYMSGRSPATRIVFYVDSENHKFTRIKMEESVIIGVDTTGIETRIDHVDAVQTLTLPRTMSTAIHLSADPSTVTSGIFVNVTANIVVAGDLAVNSSGTVTFYNNDIELGTAPVVNGSAIISNIWNERGAYSITGKYSGDGVTSEAVTSDPIIVDII